MQATLAQIAQHMCATHLLAPCCLQGPHIHAKGCNSGRANSTITYHAKPAMCSLGRGQ